MFAFSRFLLYFTEVARRGSFRKASEALHVSASSIDRQILRVEQELAMPLFERHPTGLRLTAAGELLLHAANNWKKDFTRVCEQLDDLRGCGGGMCASPPSMPLTGISFRRCSRCINVIPTSLLRGTINNMHPAGADLRRGGFRHHAQSPDLS